MKANENALRKLEIIRELAHVPYERLKEVDTFIKFILSQCKSPTKKRHKEPKTLAGIWKNKGFEKISDLDQEIDNIRKELGTQILERHKI